MSRQYNAPTQGAPSDVGVQFRTDHYLRKALIETAWTEYFTPLSNVETMPKHMGKELKKYLYVPLLDDRNVNDQGIDAAGQTILNDYEVIFQAETPSVDFATESEADAVVADLTGATKSGTGPWTVTFASPTTSVILSTEELADIVQGATGAEGSIVHARGGNLYGSSKDIGVITGKMPVLSETGGRVNRVGFKRIEVKGSLEKFGFFDEYTQESMDFDTDAELWSHINREMLVGAREISEDLIQADLINSAGVVRLPGTATALSELDDTSQPDYDDLLRLSIELDLNRTPKQTKVLTGSRLTDTKTVAAGRIMYVGSELVPMIRKMKDFHNEAAFIPVQHYATTDTILNGELGSLDHFRIVVNPEMMKKSGVGADASANTTHYSTADRYDAFPMLVVGDKSFSTIGFQSDGKNAKFKIMHKPPGEATADRNDPYGEIGFMSIKWYYGFMPERPERIALLWTTAPM